jgi:hypothetical protein
MSNYSQILKLKVTVSELRISNEGFFHEPITAGIQYQATFDYGDKPITAIMGCSAVHADTGAKHYLGESNYKVFVERLNSVLQGAVDQEAVIELDISKAPTVELDDLVKNSVH